MLYFVTLFDKSYASRGIALVHSLKNVLEKEFKLYVLAMDSETESWFRKEGEECVEIITLGDMKKHFSVLAEIEKERTHKEFCWTLSSYSLLYVMDTFEIPLCIYVDSDLYFYNSPNQLLDEMKGYSVLITEHNYTPSYDATSVSGKFCVQFMMFYNNENGRRVLTYWKEKCEEACNEKSENGVFGDQIYLNDWESRFSGIVYNCRNIGCGVAPWNLQKYSIIKQENIIMVQDKITKVAEPLFFFHFHGLSKIDRTYWKISAYQTSNDFKKYIYTPYIRRLLDLERQYQEFDCSESYYSMIELIRFSPVPYIGDRHFTLHYKQYKEEKEVYCVTVMSILANVKVLEIVVQKMSYQGDWLRILNVSSNSTFSLNAHEILWMLQKEFCFADCKDNYDLSMKMIFSRIYAHERVMTECNASLLVKQSINHPHYKTINIMRIWKSYDKESLYDYEDIINPGDSVINMNND